jgi:hypothetical protein
MRNQDTVFLEENIPNEQSVVFIWLSASAITSHLQMLSCIFIPQDKSRESQQFFFPVLHLLKPRNTFFGSE